MGGRGKGGGAGKGVRGRGKILCGEHDRVPLDTYDCNRAQSHPSLSSGQIHHHYYHRDSNPTSASQLVADMLTTVITTRPPSLDIYLSFGVSYIFIIACVSG